MDQVIDFAARRAKKLQKGNEPEVPGFGALLVPIDEEPAVKVYRVLFDAPRVEDLSVLFFSDDLSVLEGMNSDISQFHTGSVVFEIRLTKKIWIYYPMMFPEKNYISCTFYVNPYDLKQRDRKEELEPKQFSLWEAGGFVLE